MPSTVALTSISASATRARIVSTIFFMAAITLVVSLEARAISRVRSPTATRLAISPTCFGSAPNCRRTILAIISPSPMATITPNTARMIMTMVDLSVVEVF